MFDLETPVYSIDFISGRLLSPFVSRFFADLALIDPRLDFSCFKKWASGIYNFSDRYCLNDSGYFTVAFNPRFESEPLPDDLNDTFHVPDQMLASMTHRNNGIWVSVSGDGIRYMGNDTFTKFLDVLAKYNFKCNRLDVCCDLFDPDNPYVPLTLEALHNYYYDHGYVPNEVNCKSWLKRCSLSRYSNLDTYRSPELLSKIGTPAPDPGKYETINFVWGRKDSSGCRFRIYDKWLEVKTVPRLAAVADQILADVPADYWYRFEYELHYDNANQMFWQLIDRSSDPASIFGFCAYKFFSPVVSDRACFQYFSQLPIHDVWECFIDLARSASESGQLAEKIYFV